MWSSFAIQMRRNYAVRDILELFGHASGLHTNFAKCSISPIACSDVDAAEAAEVMGCQLAPYPVKYLGIPLALRRLPSEALQSLVDRIADKLPTWKVAMMPRAGRLTLIRSVLAAIPMHQLIVLSLNKKVLKQMGKILRGFLWVGRKDAHGGNCHVGLGIPDLARTAISLRVRWLWRMRTDPLRPWRGLDMHLSREERAIFDISTFMVLGDGVTAVFW
jgi:hypothetical protein